MPTEFKSKKGRIWNLSQKLKIANAKYWPKVINSSHSLFDCRQVEQLQSYVLSIDSGPQKIFPCQIFKGGEENFRKVVELVYNQLYHQCAASAVHERPLHLSHVKW